MMREDKRYKCIKCDDLGERYCLGEDAAGKTRWGWTCLKCRPYNEPEREKPESEKEKYI